MNCYSKAHFVAKL